jgi:oligopeptidase B
VQEFQQWGNPKKKAEYEYMKQYCPYSNLRSTSYPAMLVMTSLNDSQVLYHEPTKYVAKLRTLRTDSRPLLLKCNMDAGHGGASGRYDKLKEEAFWMSFMLDQLGVNTASNGNQ